MLRKLVVIGLVGITALAANIAIADDAPLSDTYPIGASGVSFADAQDTEGFADRLSLSIRETDGPRFAAATQGASFAPAPERSSSYEVAVVARALRDVDVAFAQRAGLGFNEDGDISQRSRGSELRLGQGLGMRADRPSQAPSWYFFAGSQDEAVVWRPNSTSEFGGASSGFAVQNRVEVGDRQAGITYEVHGIQTSLAYVERKIRYTVGSRHFSDNENFAGITVTMRH